MEPLRQLTDHFFPRNSLSLAAPVEPWGLGGGAAARWLRQAKIFPN